MHSVLFQNKSILTKPFLESEREIAKAGSNSYIGNMEAAMAMIILRLHTVVMD
jgi:hypothetical protein